MRPCLSAPLKIRNQSFGGEAGLFCVPLVAATHEELLGQATNVALLKPDVVEWRSDFYDDLSEAAVSRAAAGLRKALGDAILLFTLRDPSEGGNKHLAPDERVQCIEAAIRTRAFDLVDVELSSGPDVIKRVQSSGRDHGARLVLSFHDFKATPDHDALSAKAEAMIEAGADIVKLACMPQEPGDVLRLLDFTIRTRKKFPTVPLCTMSMGGMGCLSRVAGFVYGSDMAFAVGDKVSAPGQIPIQEARQIAATLLKYL